MVGKGVIVTTAPCRALSGHGACLLMTTTTTATTTTPLTGRLAACSDWGRTAGLRGGLSHHHYSRTAAAQTHFSRMGMLPAAQV